MATFSLVAVVLFFISNQCIADNANVLQFDLLNQNDWDVYQIHKSDTHIYHGQRLMMNGGENSNDVVLHGTASKCRVDTTDQSICVDWDDMNGFKITLHSNNDEITELHLEQEQDRTLKRRMLGNVWNCFRTEHPSETCAFYDESKRRLSVKFGSENAAKMQYWNDDAYDNNEYYEYNAGDDMDVNSELDKIQKNAQDDASQLQKDVKNDANAFLKDDFDKIDDEQMQHYHNMEEGGDYRADSAFDHYRYSDKKQLTAFLFSFFLGSFGVGRFYVGDYLAGSFKLLLFVLPFIAITGFCCLAICQLCVSDEEGMDGLWKMLTGSGIPVVVCSICCCNILMVWWLVDVILFGVNEIPDCYGRTLYPM